MPPISEKRSPPHIKENTKENITSTATTASGKGLEILDFRESWLQEIEVYKDQVRAQQLLAAHNHLHMVEGCQRETSAKDAAMTTPTRTVEKRRARTRSDSDSQDRSRYHKDCDYELVLKRPREEFPATSAAPATTCNKNNSNTHSNHPPTSSPATTTTAAAGCSSTANGGHKIIINNFHASTLLNSNQLDKAKLIANGVPSAASASTPQNHNSNHSHSSNSSASSPTKASQTTASGKTDTTKTGPSSTREIQDENLVSNASAAKSKEDNLTEECPANEVRNSNNGSEGKSDDDIGSNAGEDDDEFGDIDNIAVFDDSSDDSDDEYTGYSFQLTADEPKDDEEHEPQSDLSNAKYITPKSILTPSLFPMVPPYLTFASHVEKTPAPPPELHKILKWKLSPVMPKIVKKVVLNSGFRLIKKTTDWMGVWEKHMKSPCFQTIRSHQKFNHLPGSFKIGRKDSVWRNLRGYMQRHGRSEFGFMQKTFILPQELDNLKKAWPKYYKKSTKWIVKPPASARGTGISVVNKWTDFPKQKPLIVQKYIERPLLINGSKFDLRIYVIVTSINPLRIFMHKDGLARFASVQYSNEATTLSDRCMHLTNYSINKLSASYAKNEDINACQGHKWTLKSLWSFLRKRGVNTNRLWGTLRNLVIKTVIGGEKCLNSMFKQNVKSRYNCYELFGFDVLLDENLIPWLLEVNISPSLHSDLPLDMHIKGPLMQAVLNTALYQVPPKLSEKTQKEIMQQMNLTGPLCYDKRLYTMCLSEDEIKKHNEFTNRSMELREEYLDTILDDLTPDDVRCLIQTEDELARSSPLERIFPSPESHIYLKFLEGPRYYNRLIDAWETRYGYDRPSGIKKLQELCASGLHLQVPPAALEKEPSVEVTDIDLLHVYPSNKPENGANVDKTSTTAPTTNVVANPDSNPVSPQTCSKLANTTSPTQSHSRPIAVDVK